MRNATPWNVPIGAPELLAGLGVRHGRVEGRLGETHGQGADADPPAIEDLEERPEAIATRAEHVGRRDADALEDQLARRRRVQPQLLLEPADREARRRRRDDERADLGRAVVASAGPGRHDVRAGLAGVGDEPLRAVDDPRAAVGSLFVAGRRPGAAGVAAGAGLGQPVGAEDVAPGHGHEVARDLVGRAGEMERAAAEARVGRHDQAEAAPDPADLLDRDGVGQRVEPGAAFLLRERDAQPAHRAQAVDDRTREAPRLLVLVDDRSDLGHHEIADGFAQERVLRREVEVHGRRVAPAHEASGRERAGDAPDAAGQRAGRSFASLPPCPSTPSSTPTPSLAESGSTAFRRSGGSRTTTRRNSSGRSSTTSARPGHPRPTRSAAGSGPVGRVRSSSSGRSRRPAWQLTRP